MRLEALCLRLCPEQLCKLSAPRYTFTQELKEVAIIGAGASGLTCGYYLARLGYEVTIFEAESVAGGVLAFGIPEYRLPSEVIQREIEEIEKPV